MEYASDEARRLVQTMRGCHHGKTWAEYCRDCEIVGLRQTYADSMRRARNAEQRLLAMRALEQARAEVARLTKAITFEQHWLERIGTHGPGCYQWGPSHWLCAVEEIKRLAALRGEGE